MRIYVASSWRNERQPEIVKALRAEGHEVYDFKNPKPYTGFAWSEIDENWENWTNEQYFNALNHPRAIQGFESDFKAMQWADVCVLVMPCGRSAHIEAGWMKGANKPTVILIEEKAEPELMYKLCDLVTDSLDQVISFIKEKSMATWPIVSDVNDMINWFVSISIYCDYNGIDLGNQKIVLNELKEAYLNGVSPEEYATLHYSKVSPDNCNGNS